MIALLVIVAMLVPDAVLIVAIAAIDRATAAPHASAAIEVSP